MLFSNKEGFVIGSEEGLIMAFNIVRSPNGYDFVKLTEIRESSGVKFLQSFRGNNDLVITSLLNGETKFLSLKSNLNLNTISGCKSPLSFFILTCYKNNPDVYLLAMEPFGFKIADVDSPEFKYIPTNCQKNYRFENLGFPSW